MTARPTPIPLTFDGGLQTDPSFSPDGQWIAYASDSGGNFDIWIRRLSGGDPIRITDDAASDYQPDWSPDGNQLVFRSERADGGLVVVPATGGAARQISRAGFRPRWSPDGHQILFAKVFLTGLNLSLEIMDAGSGATHRWPAVSVATTPDPTLGTPRVIFDQPYPYGSTVALTNYDVSADGQRFLMVKSESGVAHLSVVLNWFSHLARLAPGGSR